MPKYIDICDFKLAIGKIVEGIRDDMSERLGIPNGFFYVTASILKDGKMVEFDNSNITGLTLSDGAPKIYEFGNDDEAHSMIVRVVFNAEEIHMEEEIPLKLTEESYTFNTYKEYLEFFTKKFEEVFPKGTNFLIIRGLFKGSGIGVPFTLAKKKYKGAEDTQISSSDFTSLRKYVLLPEAIRSKVDEDLCPFTIQRENVCWFPDTRDIVVYIDKPGLVGGQFSTNQYDDIVKGILDEVVNDQ